MSLSEEQKIRIAENKYLAMKKLTEKQNGNVRSNQNNATSGRLNSPSTSNVARGSDVNSQLNHNSMMNTKCNNDVKSRIEQNRLKALEKLNQHKISPPKNYVKSSTACTSIAVLPQNSVSPPCKLFSLNKPTTPQKPTSAGSVNIFKSPNSKSSDKNGFLNSDSSRNSVNSSRNTITASFYGPQSADNNPRPLNRVPTPTFLSRPKNGPRLSNNTAKKLKFGSSVASCVRGVCQLISRKRFEVVVTYHPALVEIFKAMKSKTYDASARKWTFLLEDHTNLINAARVLQPAVLLDPLPKVILKSFGKQLKGDYSDTNVPDANLRGVDPVLVDALLQFQREGVNYGVMKGGRLLLADDMGLGKTIQALCLARYYSDDWPLLIVTPSSVRFDWAQQVKRWLPSIDPARINVVTKTSEDCEAGLVNIMSYDIMARQADVLKTRAFRIVIMDECHMLKNIKTTRTKAAVAVLKNARRVILLSGTPALSRPCELYTQVNVICPGLMSYVEFGQRYCDGKQQPWGWDFSGSSNLGELEILLEQALMIRRLKRDVLKQLPDKVRQVVQLDPASIKETKTLETSSSLMKCNKLKGRERRGLLLEYFHQTGNAKLSAVRDYIGDVVEGGSKVLVFAHHKEVLDSLEDLVRSKIEQNYMRIDGRTSSEQRKLSCDLFQTRADIQVALLSITAANAGINLSAAAIVIFAELFWNPGILVQAEDRAHRIGQEDSVNVYYLVAPGTADDYIWPLIQTKLEVLGKAGLAKENFSELKSTNLKLQSTPNTIEKYFEESFIEEPEAPPTARLNGGDKQDIGDTDYSQLFEDMQGLATEKTNDLIGWLDEKWDGDCEPQQKKQKV